MQAGQLVAAPAGRVYSPDLDLVSFTCSSPVGGLVAVWTTGEGDTVVRRTSQAGAGWEDVTTCDTELASPEALEPGEDEDPRQVFLGALFAPGAFLTSTLLRTLAIFRRCLEGGGGAGEQGAEPVWDRLRQEVVSAVEAEVAAGLAEYEVDHLN